MNNKIKFEKKFDPQLEVIFLFCRPQSAVKLTHEDCVQVTEKLSVGCGEQLA